MIAATFTTRGKRPAPVTAYAGSPRFIQRGERRPSVRYGERLKSLPMARARGLWARLVGRR